MLLILFANNAGSGDVTAPTLVSAVISGSELRLTFDEAVTIGAGGSGGWALTLSGGACTATYSSGANTTILVYSLSRTPATSETGTIDYTQPVDGIEDIAGNDLDSIVAESVTILAVGGFSMAHVPAVAIARNISRLIAG